ncbi:hypothetical protein DKX38_022895 [Salix brachista]|uniref:Thiamine pyrophosphate enzyme TPP-binding domain-containing protein n=1 Tax=Salix brachista TaxID=2182728 RepID=A0A5N5K2F1_9ROSI|nr:hypothetical protein DKX38_022895 [Salix brachista]
MILDSRETKNGTDFKAWREELNEQKVKCPLTFNASGEEILLQHAFLMNYLMWLKSGGLGAMVFGFPAAMGAAIANPDAIAVDMDEAFGIPASHVTRKDGVIEQQFRKC